MRSLQSVITICAVLLGGCSFRSQPDDVDPGTLVDAVDPATIVSTTDPGASYAETLGELARSEDWSPDDFLDAYAPTFQSLDYDPTTAEYLDLVNQSTFALSDDESARLGRDGFVITADQFPTFAYGYRTIYLEDLPVYVSADSILFALHRSYDKILARLERDYLVGALAELLDAMRTQLRAGRALGFTGDQETDLDLYLAVAATLLNETPRAALVGADQSRIDALVSSAIAASGAESLALFGSERRVDWSQFEPRGHYTDDPQLERYFRAMMWLGRIDFRMLEPNDANELEFRRRQFYDTLAMANLIDEDSRAKFELIHTTIGAFVGEPDGLVVTQVPDLLEALGASDPTDVKPMSDAEIATALQKYEFGAQRIASHFMVNGIANTTKLLSYSFALMGQRYVLDSHVFANVVFDRAGGGSIMRMMPKPLDVAFAALGNDQAGVLLEPELREYGYQHDLDAMRLLSDAHGADFWGANLYNTWLSALRTLSPGGTDDDGRPSVARSEPWGRRLLQTQLASWAELRHDTILYAKQSYTTGNSCEFPDAYVEPYPEFFVAIGAFAVRGRDAVAPFAASDLTEYFERLGTAAARLQSMAEHQRSGAPHDAADVAWINDAVASEDGCDGPSFWTGWYIDLFYDQSDMELDPTIADVHTQPTDEAGDTVGRVLHVGTGYAKGLVVTVDTCVGPRAYVGLASSYYEAITENFERLDDEAWASQVTGGNLVPPQWAP